MITTIQGYRLLVESTSNLQIIQLPEFVLKMTYQHYPEVLPYEIFDIHHKNLGNITLVQRSTCFQVHTVTLHTPGQGIGFKLYSQLIEFLPMPLESSKIRSSNSNDLWSKLVRTGHAMYDPLKNVYTSK